MLLVLSIMASGTALASSPDAWEALFRKSAAACEKASELKEARIVGRPVDFETTVLVIVEGRWPQPHMNNAKARFACLYGKRSGRAEARELSDR